MKNKAKEPKVQDQTIYGDFATEGQVVYIKDGVLIYEDEASREELKPTPENIKAFVQDAIGLRIEWARDDDEKLNSLMEEYEDLREDFGWSEEEDKKFKDYHGWRNLLGYAKLSTEKFWDIAKYELINKAKHCIENAKEQSGYDFDFCVNDKDPTSDHNFYTMFRDIGEKIFTKEFYERDENLKFDHVVNYDIIANRAFHMAEEQIFTEDELDSIRANRNERCDEGYIYAGHVEDVCPECNILLLSSTSFTDGKTYQALPLSSLDTLPEVGKEIKISYDDEGNGKVTSIKHSHELER